MADTAQQAGPKGAAAPETSTLAHRVAVMADKIKYFILVLLVVVAAAAFFLSNQRREQAARENAAESGLYQTTIDLVTSPESDGIALFGKAAKDYAGLPAGARALVYQFSYAFNSRDFTAAETAAREFLKDYPKHALAARMRLALGQSLAMQNKLSEAQALFREVAASQDQGLIPEAKLALAQSLERQAEIVKGDPEEYRRRLELAEAEYSDISARARAQGLGRAFWPQSVTMPADFALAVIRDRLNGYKLSSPTGGQDRPGADGSGFIMVEPTVIPRVPESELEALGLSGDAAEPEDAGESAAPAENDGEASVQ